MIELASTKLIGFQLLLYTRYDFKKFLYRINDLL